MARPNEEGSALMKPLVISAVAALSIIGLAACSAPPPPPPPQQAAAPPPQYMPPPPPPAEMAPPPAEYVRHCPRGRHWIPAHYTRNHHRVRGHCSWGHGYRPR